MKAVKIPVPKEKLRIEESPIPEIRGHSVLVRVHASGICHTDLHLWEGGYHGAPGVFMKYEDRGVVYPMIPGHEIAGVVERVGPDVTQIKAGEKVVVYPWIGCGVCPVCGKGRENHCEKPRSIGFFLDGGYAEYVVIPHERYLISLKSLGFEEAASLACSGLTAFHAVELVDAAAGETAVLVGMGGVGLMGVQMMKLLTKATVVAVDLSDESLEQAKAKGAEITINPRREDISDVLKKRTGSSTAEMIVDFVNSTQTVDQDLQLVRKGGKLILVGLFGGHVSLNLPTVPLRGLQILGCLTGNLGQLAKVVSLAERNPLKPVIAKRFSLDEADHALSLLKEGKIVGRAVLCPAG